ncbi:hypothetical protein, partial [Mucilaginibacter sp.]|uniref:hypothetical protein n=1 Tax=Mucilaginibacter sp. TaxID=1882438 RepID=UPI003264CBF0
MLLFLSFAFYLLTIRNALKNYNVRKFEYSTPAPANVQTFRERQLAAFYSEIVRDMLFSIQRNTKLNSGTPAYFGRRHLLYQNGISYYSGWNLTGITDPNGNGVGLSYN